MCKSLWRRCGQLLDVVDSCGYKRGKVWRKVIMKFSPIEIGRN